MTAAEFNSRFDLICDKVGSPYFTAGEKESFIMTAQYSIIDELMFPKRRNQEKKDQDVFGFQYQNSMLQGLQKLRVETGDIEIVSPNQITFASITSAPNSKPVPYKIINFSLPEDVLVPSAYYNAKYVPSLTSTISIYSNLQFGKANSTKYGIYTVMGDVIKFSPALANADTVRIEYIRVPANFNIAGNVTCEVDPIYHNEILFRALQLAGIAIRENEFYQAVSIEQQKES